MMCLIFKFILENGFHIVAKVKKVNSYKNIFYQEIFEPPHYF